MGTWGKLLRTKGVIVIFAMVEVGKTICLLLAQVLTPELGV